MGRPPRRIVCATALVHTLVAAMTTLGCDTSASSGHANRAIDPEQASEARAQLDQAGIEVDEMTLLTRAESGDTDTVVLLLNAGLSPDTQHSSSGASALMVAANYGRVETARTLIDFGADLDAQDMQGDTALTRAASFGHTELASTLIEAGANLDVIGQRGRNALMMAVASRNNEIVRLLIEAGADQTGRDAEGKTVTELAEAYGNAEAQAILRDGPAG